LITGPYLVSIHPLWRNQVFWADAGSPEKNLVFRLNASLQLNDFGVKSGMINVILLRDVVEEDLAIFFEQQLDAEANFMAAFTAKDPTDQKAFMAHWHRILADTAVIIRTIEYAGQVVGHVLSYEDAGKPEVSYWIGKAYWGQGYATQALAAFLAQVNQTRPIYARVAQDNLPSRRVLEKCGFVIIEESSGFANARGGEIAELLLKLR
jgi:RimJ/RimL family protein N-acetyltransferase